MLSKLIQVSLGNHGNSHRCPKVTMVTVTGVLALVLIGRLLGVLLMTAARYMIYNLICTCAHLH